MSSKIFIKFADKEGVQFEVHSDSGEVYMVTWDFDNGWMCDCKGCLLGKHLCKHICACITYMNFVNMALLNDHHVFKGEVIG